jgi:hypothetical protein
MTIPLTYTLDQLRMALQEHSLDTTRNIIRRLEEAHGFPHHLPGCKVLKWSRPAVDQWFLNWDAPPAPAGAGGAADALHDIRKAMIASYRKEA